MRIIPNLVHHTFKIHKAGIALPLENWVNICTRLHLSPEFIDCSRECHTELWRPNEKVARHTHECHDVMDDVGAVIHVARSLELLKERVCEIEENRLKSYDRLWSRRLRRETRRATELRRHSDVL